MMQAGTHPDFLRVACPEGKSELPIELLVGSRENRGGEGLCHDLSLRPMAARRRVAVIDDADRMSNESANALLKTLEEPPSYAVIVLIAADSASMLATIRSRCQTVRFSPLSREHVARLLTQLEWTENPEEADAIAALAGGSLEVAQQLSNSELRGSIGPVRGPRHAPHPNAHVRATGARGTGPYRRRQSATTDQRPMGRALHARVLRAVAAAGGRNVAEDPAAGAPSTAEDGTEMIGGAIDRCVVAEQQLAGNVSIPLCLETLLSDLATIRST